LVLLFFLYFNVLVAFDGMGVFFDFTLCFISCDGYFVERKLYNCSCNVDVMSFALLYVIFHLNG